jgi:hypothetical protein
MVRVVVVAYLVVVTAAGPWLCCCTPARLAAMLPSPSTTVPSTSARHDCCTGHGEAAHRSAPAGVQDRAPPSGHPCPCQGATPCSVMLPPAPEGTDPSADAPSQSLIGPASVPMMDGVLTSCPAPAFQGARGAPPFLTADDLLHVLHRLRC